MNQSVPARIAAFSLAALISLGGSLGSLSAQTVEETIGSKQPQIAYRILNDYIDKKAKKDADEQFGWGLGLSIVGGLALGTAGGVALADPSLFPASDPDLKWRIAAGAGISGAVMTGIGIGLLASPVPDYREKYHLVFEETDPLVQEALAASTLKEMASVGRDRRVASGLTSILSPLVYMGVMAAINVANNRTWYSSLDNNVWWLASGAVSGGISLLTPSSEERLFEKYLSARDAMYAIPGGGK